MNIWGKIVAVGLRVIVSYLEKWKDTFKYERMIQDVGILVSVDEIWLMVSFDIACKSIR